MRSSTSLRLMLVLCCMVISGIAIANAGDFFVAQVSLINPGSLYPMYTILDVVIGTPPQPQNLVLAVDYTTLPWVACGTRFSGPAPFHLQSSSSFSFVRNCMGQMGPTVCTAKVPPFKLVGAVAQDVFAIQQEPTPVAAESPASAPSSAPEWPTSTAGVQMAFACVPTGSDTGPLAGAGYGGFATFSGNNNSVPAQLAVNADISQVFAYCLPRSTPGVWWPRPGPSPLFFGRGPGYFFGQPPVSVNMSNYLTAGPAAKLLRGRDGSLSLALTAVTVDSQNISYNMLHRKPVKLHLSTVEPYTRLTRALYRSLRNKFRAFAAYRGLLAADAVAPFDTCYYSSSIGFSRTGPAVPLIELHVSPEAAAASWAPDYRYQIYGFNSMVAVSGDVSCWAFLDAGRNQASVLGSFQQQNILVQYDLELRRFASTGLLDFFEQSCTNFVF